MTDVDAILTGGRLPEDRVPVCTRSDLVQEWSRLRDELAMARVRQQADPRLAGGELSKLVEAMEAKKAEVDAATVEFVVRALPPKVWAELVDEHPPRKDDDADLRMDVNRDTFLPVMVRRCTVSPELQPETWERLLDLESGLLSGPQWAKLWRACWNLNVRDLDVPFSVAGLLPSLGSGSGSGSPEPSA